MFAVLDIPWVPIFLIAIFGFHPLLGWLALGEGLFLIMIAAVNQILGFSPINAANQKAKASDALANVLQSQGEVLRGLDMSLPIMDGWEVAGHLNANPETQSIPIIAPTAHAMAGDKAKALEAGCDDYDTKPIDFKRLLRKIEALLA